MFKIKPHQLMQVGVGALLVATLFTIEIKSIVGATEAHAGFSGASWAAISGMFALLALAAYGIAGHLKDDYREHVQKRAKFARTIALCAMLVPASFLGSSMKAENMADRRAAYMTPAQAGQPSPYQIDLNTVNDEMGDTFERREARERIQLNARTAIELSPADGEFWAALFFQIIMLVGADALRIPSPMTKEEYQMLKNKERGRKSADTRARNKANANVTDLGEVRTRKRRAVKAS